MYVKCLQLLLGKLYLHLYKHNCSIILAFYLTTDPHSQDWGLTAASTPGIHKWREQSFPVGFTPNIAKTEKC